VNTRYLGGPLLRSVSRSFYLTIRLLPGELRAPIGLAYLLARASDTIADSARAPAASRRVHLADFRQMLRHGNAEGLPGLQNAIDSEHAGERKLIAHLDRCIAWLGTLPDFDRTAIVAVLEKIIHGQTLDLERFPGTGEIVTLPDAAALEEYTYLVAGCVGEFWTQLCAHHLPRYSTLPLEELSALGIEFGKGLQLVNILRDLPSDLRTGRSYLPGDPRTLFPRWHTRTKELLDAGRRYIAAIRPARVRAGCFLPWYLGVKTLALLEAQSPLDSDTRIKVPRSTVRTALLLAPFAAFSNRALGIPKL
jgi:farnesyl-diphosphate farnesyltransferase